MDNTHQKHVFKKDRYSRARRGNSHFLDIFCSTCKDHIFLYQKDGLGALIRAYLDRIFDPMELATLQARWRGKGDMMRLECSNCHALIGIPMVYKPENRLAFRLVRGAFGKKKSDGTYPPKL